MQKSELIAAKYAELGRMIDAGAFLEDRRAVVKEAKQAGLALPTQEIGETVAAFQNILAKPGVVVVGSIAFETYCGMKGLLGLSQALISTRDVDIACASMNATASSPPATAENSMIRLTHNHGVTVDFLTPQSREQEKQGATTPAAYVPLMRSYAMVMPGDFRLLLHEARPAVVFHDAGIKVSVPHPLRFALHKLAVSCSRRHAEKRDKDRQQAALILNEFSDEMNDRKDIAATFLSYGQKLTQTINEGREVIEPLLSVHAKNWLHAGAQLAQQKIT